MKFVHFITCPPARLDSNQDCQVEAGSRSDANRGEGDNGVDDEEEIFYDSQVLINTERRCPMSEAGQGCPMAVLCIDRLYYLAMLNKVVELFGTKVIDVHSMPGGAKAIVEEKGMNPAQQTHLNDIVFGVEHHGTNRGAIVSHTKCGKYPEFRTKEEEIAALRKDLRTASAMLQKRLRHLQVDMFIYDVDSGELTPVPA